MLPKYHIILHVYYVHSVIWIVLFQVLQYLQFNARLIVVLLLVLDHLKCNVLFPFVIEALESDPERAFAEELLNLVPVTDMVSHHDLIVTLVVIVAEVVLTLKGTFDFLTT